VNSFLGNSFEKSVIAISFILNFGKSPGGKPSRVKKSAKFSVVLIKCKVKFG